MVYADPAGQISPLYLKDLQDPETGKIPPRLVDINSDKFTMVIKNILNYVTPADYEAAKNTCRIRKLSISTRFWSGTNNPFRRIKNRSGLHPSGAAPDC